MRGFLLASLVVLLCASIEAQVATCESPQGAYRECSIGSSGVIALVGETSEGRCAEGATWGTVSAGVVWVDRGCRGRFIIRDSRMTPGSRRVVCESQKGDRQLCAADLVQASDPGGGVFLARQLSPAPCNENETWRYDAERDQIWVEKGCRASRAAFCRGRLRGHTFVQLGFPRAKRGALRGARLSSAPPRAGRIRHEIGYA